MPDIGFAVLFQRSRQGDYNTSRLPLHPFTVENAGQKERIAEDAWALLVQPTLEEHYAFVLAYTHLVRDEGVQHTRARFESVPAIVRPMVANFVCTQVKKLFWYQGVLRHSDKNIIESAIRGWRAVLIVMGSPFFFGDEPTGVDAIVFGALATTVLTPITSPIRDFLSSQPGSVAYAERMRARFFPSLHSPQRTRAAFWQREHRLPRRSPCAHTRCFKYQSASQAFPDRLFAQAMSAFGGKADMWHFAYSEMVS